MPRWSTVVLWPLDAAQRFRRAFRQYWKRILVGAFVGWLYASVGGAFGLALLEFWGVVSRGLSDSLGIVTVFAGLAAGALIAYAGRPAQGPSGVMTRR